jgi:putative hydroxymethylpyrimidine transport system permease protein
MAKQVVRSFTGNLLMRLFIRGLLLIFSLLLIWQSSVVILQLPSYLLPTPLQVLHSLTTHHVMITLNLLPTLIETLLGLFFGILLGISLALSMSLFRPVHSLLLPILLISQALPIFAIAPLLVIWFGYGITAKIATTTLMLFFPIANNFLDGLKKTSPHYLDNAQLMGANRWRMLYHIRIPAALPQLALGIRLATAMAPLGAVIGEWVGSNQGLGFLLLSSNAQMQIDLMFATLSMLILLTISIYFLVDKLLYFSMPWLTIKK